MTRRVCFFIAVAVAICFGSTVLTAEEPDTKHLPKERLSDLFDNLDNNQDGLITDDEVPAEHRRLFERLKRRSDKNGDSKLSKDEFAKGLDEDRPEGPPRDLGDKREGVQHEERNRRNGPPEGRRRGFGDRESEPGDHGPPPGEQGPDARRPNGERRPGAEGRPEGPPPSRRAMWLGPALMRALDADRDGKLNSSEISEAATALKKLDKNGDGDVSREELMPPQIAGDFPGFRGRPDDEPGRSPDNRERPTLEMLLNRLKQLDKDGDGKFKKDELPERMRQRFEQLDANSDGLVDESEIKDSLPRHMHRPDGGTNRPDGPDGHRRPDPPEEHDDKEGKPEKK